MKFRMALAGLALIAAPLAVVAAKDWNAVQSVSPKGHKVGNPDAKAKLIQFVSYTCIHCAHFEQASDAPLRAGFIMEGKTEVEVRHVIRNPIDLAAALSTECGKPTNFFANHRAMMFTHDSWMAKAQAANKAQQNRWFTGTLGSRMQAIAGDLGFYAIMEKRGVDRVALDRCLADEAKARLITANAQANSAEFGYTGTPSFALNGKLLDNVHDWPSLQVALTAAAQ